MCDSVIPNLGFSVIMFLLIISILYLLSASHSTELLGNCSRNLDTLPDPRPLRAVLQASYHRTLRGQRVRGDDPNALPPHLQGRAGKGHLPPDRGDHSVSGAQQGAYTPPPLFSNWPGWTTATTVIPQRPLPAPFRPLFQASSLPPLHRLGRWPHLYRLPLHQPHGCPPLQLSHTSHGSGPGGYVDGTPPGRPIPGRASSV